MNLLELQTRANALVQKVNEYEETIAGVELDEDEILNEHTYVDLFSLRMIMHRLFGKTPNDRSSNLTTTDGVTWYYLPQSKAGHIYYGNINSNQFTYGSTAVTRGRFSDNNDLYTNYNMLVIDPNLSNAWQYSDTPIDVQRQITSMANTVFGADIRDALVTESQTANIFKWNTTSEDDVTSYASAYVVPQQVPGIVCYYLGSGYDGTYTATVPFNTSYSTNQPNNATPALYGAYYIDQNVGPGPSGIVSQQAENRGAEGLRMFMPGLTYFNGTSISPINIWQPFPRLDTNYGYNYQGKALYHELVFKRRRAGCKAAGLDFIPDVTVDNGICDNDPQGLAMRLALAQQKPYYYNRPWFKELDEYYTAEGTKQAQLADKLVSTFTTDVEIDYNTTNVTLSGSGSPTVTDGVQNVASWDLCGFIRYNAIGYDEIRDKSTFISPIITRSTNTDDTNMLIRHRCVGTDSTGRTITGLSITDSGKLMTYSGAAELIETYSNLYMTIQLKIEVTNTTDIAIYQRDASQENSDWELLRASAPIPQITAYKPSEFTYNCNRTNGTRTYNFNAMKLIIEGIGGPGAMTDNEFYNGYQLDYDTYAEALGEPL